MTEQIMLHEPEERDVPHFDRTIAADVVITTNRAEAAYYLTGSTGVVPWFKAEGKHVTISLHDVSRKELRQKYKAYRNNEYFTDIQHFFNRYRYVQERCRKARKCKGATL